MQVTIQVPDGQLPDYEFGWPVVLTIVRPDRKSYYRVLGNILGGCNVHIDPSLFPEPVEVDQTLKAGGAIQIYPN